MARHKHVELIKRYAEIAGVTDEPEKFVRYKDILKELKWRWRNDIR